ncbi:TOMM precursor leader peptide-binding protein [Actinosynnema sp. NPDC047251]|uniref:Putative cyclodehydratase n=1 Tax=Saccharothrix espanaensis (strain ATCC 51144 / DSM 44229 / JCM 9112 / NBRC 15066 / NRRL 15764) TaxID=1179773 RepID=K0K515_SACES|nr:TOMM precursor leader peptide-binding protein [Saccharothrix espanaensis]CCH32677.1 putative cyclodehydratase [Saccharothrix espanaensis DSM 44229]
MTLHVLDAPPTEEHLALVDEESGVGGRSTTAWWEPGKVILGPTSRAGVPGCLRCLVSRRAACRPEAVPTVARFAREGRVRFDDRHRLIRPLLAELVRARVDTAGAPHTAFQVLSLKDLAVANRKFLPDPLCPTCGSVPDDGPPAPDVFEVPVPKPAPDRYRVRNLLDSADALRDLYVDEEAGLVRHIRRSAHGLFPTATAPAGLRVSPRQEIGFGRQGSFLGAEVTAVAEALERSGGAQPGGRRTAVRDSFARLRDTAVDPREFGLHEPEQYTGANFPFHPFDEDREIPWVWAHSLTAGTAVLVPECFAYYEPLYHRTETPSLAYEISNGCAIGSNPTEAALHGLFEIAERDAFLLTWYCRVRPVEVELDPVRDTALRLMVERIERLSGYRIHLFDITTDLGVPAVWVLAVDEHDRPGQPKALCAAGAHLDLGTAFEGALLELAPFTSEFPPAYRANRDRALAMLDDPDEVRHMEDHRLLYCAPEAFPRLEFLLDPVDRLSLADAARRHAEPHRHDDLRDDLADVVERVGDAGLPVLVVDQTTPEHRLGGFRCVKVLVPGSVPMTFGHWARRCDLDRLRTAPARMGRAGGPLTRADLNLLPHPFP